MPPRHHRLLLGQPPETGDRSSDSYENLVTCFAAILIATLAYVFLNLTCQLIFRIIHHRNPGEVMPNSAIPQNEPNRETGVELRSIPTLVYGFLPLQAPSGSTGESCSVCLAEYTAGEEVRILPRCRHMFHKDCIDRWLTAARSTLCPMCRDPVVVADRSDGCCCQSSDDGSAGDGSGSGRQLPQPLEARYQIQLVTPQFSCLKADHECHI